MGTAYALAPHHDIVVFEKNNRIGGHSRTISIPTSNGPIPVDTGFIVFNDRNYPILTKLFNHLRVPYEKSDMSFGASIDGGAMEYGSKGLFAQPRNIFRAKFWRMLADILRFNRGAEKYLLRDDMTLAQCLQDFGAGEWFKKYYLLAMGASIWSCPIETIENFPASSFIRFFKNHGLLTINDHPQWYTVTGGSRVYIEKLTQSFLNKIRVGYRISHIRRSENQVEVADENGQIEYFDKIVLACHADETLALLADASDAERSVLGSFQFQKNHVIVHNDKSFMPKIKKCWASWVYLSEQALDDKPAISLTYWMNNLQNIDSKNPVFVTLNPGRRPDAASIYDEYDFMHPIFDGSAIAAQSRINSIQGINKTYFCGAWQRYGFHEDGIHSAVQVANHLGIHPPWA